MREMLAIACGAAGFMGGILVTHQSAAHFVEKVSEDIQTTYQSYQSYTYPGPFFGLEDTWDAYGIVRDMNREMRYLILDAVSPYASRETLRLRISYDDTPKVSRDPSDIHRADAERATTFNDIIIGSNIGVRLKRQSGDFYATSITVSGAKPRQSP
ncbi:hypothetical protein HY418_03715 [Candidatus Kaiserbacteria bacterium]|nr:hypothetical protein [Candidatus Kaiserbacteria bacterium]